VKTAPPREGFTLGPTGALAPAFLKIKVQKSQYEYI